MNNADDRILKCQFGISKLIYDIDEKVETNIKLE